MPAINKDIVEALNIASHFPVIKKVGVFGSYARGEQTIDSDVDVLYDFFYDDKDTSHILEVLEFIEEAENELKKRLGNHIKSDYVSLSGIMESHNKSFRDSVLNDIIWVYVCSEDGRTTNS